MKDIDNLQKRSRKLRDFAETMGSSGLAFTGLVGLLFLAILVWQITAPTFIDGESGEIPAANEFITCLLYTSPSPRDGIGSRMPSSA